MRHFFSSRLTLIRVSTTFLIAIVFFVNIPLSVSAAAAVDIKINGSDGPVTITEGAQFSYNWTSSDSTACILTSPTGDSGIALSGTGGPIGSGHSWYPTVATSTTLTINCTNGTSTTTDSVVVNLTTLLPTTGSITFLAAKLARNYQFSSTYSFTPTYLSTTKVKNSQSK